MRIRFGIPLCGLALFGSLGPASAQSEPSTDSEGLSFLVIGDWGMGNTRQHDTAVGMARVAATRNPEFILTSGDNFYPDGVTSVQDTLWRKLFEEVYDEPELQIPWYPTLGNHDHGGNVQAQIDYSRVSERWRMPAAYHVLEFEVGDGARAEFFLLDTRQFLEEATAATQMEWLERRLGESTADWRIVVGHHPVYTSSRPYQAPGRTMLGLLQPLFERHGVDVYIAGHDHDLQHIRPRRQTVDYFISGAGAGPRPVGMMEDRLFGYSESGGFMHGRLTATALEVTFFDETGRELYRTSVEGGRGQPASQCQCRPNHDTHEPSRRLRSGS